ncbi:MAG: hypothetical protein DRO94_04865 [Candidatus Altiarchaeales archaeon]|nr:MAG: hypothetical protein DRO94_04865 [Candidatus Altiarchaeales archaeon]
MLLELVRIRNALIVFFGVIVSATFILTCDLTDNAEVGNVIIAGIAASLITGAGNAINDYFDSEVDKINKPKKPIPSGRIAKPDVGMISIVLFLIGIGLSKSINDYCLIIAILNSMILILYAKYSKKALLISNLTISYLVASVFLFGVLATVDNPGEIMIGDDLRIVMIMSACAFLMTFSREIIKDIEDIEGDKREYAITLPIRIGIENAKKSAIILAIGAILLSFLPFFIHLRSFNLLSYGILIVLADIIFLISLTMHPSLGQRIMVFCMVLALIAFFLGNLTSI